MWPIKPEPQSILGGMMGLSLIFQVGCVSIKTHEEAKLKAYQAGQYDMAQKCLQISQQDLLDEITWAIKIYKDEIAKNIKVLAP